jgi:uncharacterized protein YjbI with pentapeptide repeats
MGQMTADEIRFALDEHTAWLKGERGKRLDLRGANLIGADLIGADMRGANLREADLSEANLRGTNLSGATLREANLREANLRGAYLLWANLSGANLRGANLSRADLRAFGNMRELRTMQIDIWEIGYTADTLQIGCQRHLISKWRKWGSDAGRKWIATMDSSALSWAERNLDLVLAIIDANPATPTGHETPEVAE